MDSFLNNKSNAKRTKALNPNIRILNMQEEYLADITDIIELCAIEQKLLSNLKETKIRGSLFI